ncbi:DsbA family oxidoreductase [Anabaena subtropica]|uniref:DsbA family oxidoreductase n=1 Tax=Anabaena subtropica FACHB-260 TaxID=2692884 RepID=A0ABR8CRB8_9NOST|nr:DsbA family oxidoreductase [Anabaena subtropica]MBD2345752.1 DsbA family oxidoreductase [Anabaena subtropica FACHB-260]
MLIDIFHDTVCPWCRIGKKHLFDALAQWQKETVKICWHPFLLDDTIPTAGYEFLSFMQERKGIEAATLQNLFNETRRIGQASGVTLDFDKISLAVNTKLSHQLITIAPDDSRNQVVEAIYQAYFEDGLNIGDVGVLVKIGKTYQIDASKLSNELSDNSLLDGIMAESTSARLYGITSVPFFIINNKVQVKNSGSVELFLEALNRAAIMEATTI